MKIKFSIIIPVYKSGEWLESLVEKIRIVMNDLNFGNNFELILVNDASPDKITWSKIEFLSKKYSWIKGIDLFFNQGQFKATLCGISYSCGEYLITMDDDFQHNPKDIPKLINCILNSKDIDCVFGKYSAVQESPIRTLGTSIKALLLKKFYGISPNIKTSAFRILKSDLGNSLLKFKIAHPQVTPLITFTTKKITNVNVDHSPRIKFKSNYSIFKLIKETYHILINSSLLPLRFLSFIGLFFSAFSFSLGFATFLKWYSGAIKIEGYTTLVLIITFFSGLIIFSIGLLSEYIGRIIREVSGYKDFPVRKETF